MRDALLLGIGKYIVPIPSLVWRRMIAHGEEGSAQALFFMTPEHHRVRNFVVLELPVAGQALMPDLIAARLELPVSRVVEILDDLERHLTFLYRDPDGAVAWAYPVTAARTPHRLTFSTGERINAA
jgi:hypothetical protein